MTAEGDDADIVRDFLAARELASAAERAGLEQEDVDVALADLRETYDYITEDRASP